jgi:hypothetical protein
MRYASMLVVLVLAFGIGSAAVHVVRLWIPELQAPAVPLMLAILGGIRLGSYIAHDRSGTNVDQAAAWALGFVCAGIWGWHSPVAVILPLVAALYSWSTLGMHKRHYPHHWPPPDPLQRHADAVAPQKWTPLLGNVRPAYRNPDGSWR